MVKLSAPCMSLGASGTLADAITFASWKGRAYARERVIPSNPQSALQVAMRSMLKFLSQAWTSVGSTPKGTWADRAAAGQYSPFNAFISANQRRHREFQPPSQTDPAPETGTPPVMTLDSAVGGVRSVDLTFTMTTVNQAWGIMIFRSPTGTFATSLANLIAVIPAPGVGAYVYTDSVPAAGTYYYDARAFTTEGVLGAEEGEVNGTAT